MNAQQWARAKELFLALLDHSEQDAETILRGECGADEEVWAEVQRLMKYRLSTHCFLDKRLIEQVTADDQDEEVPFLAEGQLIAGRFGIVHFLGRGGMGEVYEANDTVTETRVALKILNSEQTALLSGRERQLKREVQLAQRISHPNVCRVNDLYLNSSAKPFLVLSMELLVGQSLGQLKAEKKLLPISQLEEIARQLIGGIGAAHAAGVVHRDLKPSNVMITSTGERIRVVITDFGLARPITPDQSQATATTVGGTPLYMPPEQWEGRLDRRSDLYSLCVILYELATGQLPFEHRDQLRDAGRCRVLDPGRLNRELSSAWRLTLLKGLELRPADRFQSAQEIASSINMPSPAGEVLLKAKLLGRSLRKQARLMMILALVTTAVIIGLTLYNRKSPGIAPFSRLVFAGLNRAKEDDPVLATSEDSFFAAIRQSPYLQVIDLSGLAPSLRHMGLSPEVRPSADAIREAALRTGRHAVLFGAVSKSRGYRLHLELQIVSNNPRYPEQTSRRDFLANGPTEMFRAIQAASRWIRELSGESKTQYEEQNAAPEDLTTGSWKALQLVHEARLRRASGDSASALIFVEEALQADNSFAAAESLRGDILTELRQYRSAIEAHMRALQLVKARNLSGRERYEIESMLSEDTGNYYNGLQTYRAWVAHFPKDYLPHFYVAGLLRQLGDDDQALHEMEIARDLDDQNFVIYPHLAAHYLTQHRWNSVANCVQKLRALSEPNWALEVQGRLAFARGDYPAALSSFQKLAAADDSFWRTIAPFYVARVFAEEGRLQESERVLLVATSTDRERGLSAQEAERHVAMAYLAWQQGNAVETRENVTKSLLGLDNPESLALAGCLLARVGDLRRAESILASFDTWPNVSRVSRAKARLKADIAIARGSLNNRLDPRKRGRLERNPFAIDSALYASLRRHDAVRIHDVASMLIANPDVLLHSTSATWWETPGLFRIAVCAAASVSASKQTACLPAFSSPETIESQRGPFHPIIPHITMKVGVSPNHLNPRESN
jgi:serine/threonine protein kinase